jgi:NarL family two-component system response regulator LiaR
VRKGIRALLTEVDDLDVVGEAGDGRQAVALAQSTQPDVILMDIVMPEMDGIEVTQRIKESNPEIAILALTSYIDQNKVIDALSAGMSGYIMKDISATELIRAIKAAARDEIYFSPAAAKYVARRVSRQASSSPMPEVLTERELEVLCLLARGLNNTDIGTDLNISTKTVKTHVSNILLKLNLENRTQAALYALRHNLISLAET